jgi:GNAT superfamily N-acetyltransferase
VTGSDRARPLSVQDVVLRAAVEGDAQTIAEIHVRGWQWAYRGLVPETLLAQLSVAARANYWQRWIVEGRPRCRLWVAAWRHRSIGFAATGPSRDATAGPDTAELYAIYLEPDVVGKGVGRALCTRAVDTLESEGFRQATLWVLAGNTRARRFYERAGWHADGAERMEDWHGVPLHEVRYARELHPPR